MNTYLDESGEKHTYMRKNTDFRGIRVKRGVISQVEGVKTRNTFSASNVVFHGLSEVIAQGKLAPSEHTVLSSQPLTVKVQLVKDIQNQIRRELQEQKEAYFTQFVTQKLLSLLDFSPITAESMELSVYFNILSDDGSLPTSLMLAAWDLLKDLQNQYCSDKSVIVPRSQFLKVPVWFTVMCMVSVTG